MDLTYGQQHDTKLKHDDVTTSTDTSMDLSHELFLPLSAPYPDLSAPDFFLRGGRKTSYDIRPHTTGDLKRQRLQKTCCTTSSQISRDVKEMHWNGRRKSLKSCFLRATSTETNLPNPQTVNNTDIFVAPFLSAYQLCHVCLSVRPSSYISVIPTVRIFDIFHTDDFYVNLRRKSKFD